MMENEFMGCEVNIHSVVTREKDLCGRKWQKE